MWSSATFDIDIFLSLSIHTAIIESHRIPTPKKARRWTLVNVRDLAATDEPAIIWFWLWGLVHRSHTSSKAFGSIVEKDNRETRLTTLRTWNGNIMPVAEGNYPLERDSDNHIANFPLQNFHWISSLTLFSQTLFYHLMKPSISDYYFLFSVFALHSSKLKVLRLWTFMLLVISPLSVSASTWSGCDSLPGLDFVKLCEFSRHK